jgi:hypothetical protein
MLTGNDKPLRPHKQWLEHFFVRYGAGAHVFNPLTRSRFWNLVCWVAIGVGVLGWAVAFWILRPFQG